MATAQRTVAVATLAVVASATLLVLEAAVGLFWGSVAVVAAAVHAGVALVAAVTAVVAVKGPAGPAAARPEPVPGRLESVASTVEALLIFLAAAWVVHEAVKALVRLEPPDGAAWACGVMLLASAATLLVSRRLRAVARATGAVALQAAAWHLRAHAGAAVGLGLALGLALVGRCVAGGRSLAVVDPLAAIGVALLALWGAWRLLAVSRGGASGT